jgi:23S rRNA U2552 (ribose-2'-O)-methylase RlmE/FtsJ
MNFIFFHTVTYNEKLLIAWVKAHYPELNLSFSAPGWVTFKSQRHFPLNFSCPLALRFGQGLDIIKCPEKDLNPMWKNIEILVQDHDVDQIHYFERAEIRSEDPKILSHLKSNYPKVNSDLELGKKSLQIFKINDGLYATGLTTLNSQSFQSPFVGALKTSQIPAESPSRAYLKMAQIHDHFSIPWTKNDIVLELGASPGGITTYLLEQGLLVHAIDSAPLKIEHKNLKTIVDSVQRLKVEEVFEDTHWVVSDLNLSPKQVINEVVRLCADLPHLKGIFLTLKLTHVDLVERLEQYVRLMEKNFPEFNFKLMQVPSHKQETHLIGFRK